MLGGYVAVHGASNARHSLLMMAVTPPSRRELAPPPASQPYLLLNRIFPIRPTFIAAPADAVAMS